MKNIKKILIANRSEVVSRIQHTCTILGIKTVAVYSPEDKFLPYVHQADQACPLSLNGPQAYLNQEEIIQIALKTGADAVHPGYGFLSENSKFAQKVLDSGLLWIGPDPECIAMMGDKICARDLILKAGIPATPGFYLDNLDTKTKNTILNKIGYPIVLKDPLGGGGKAIKRIYSEEKLHESFYAVKKEAERYTGSKLLLLEKYIQNGRHIEIQIAGDGKNFIHLYERECSIQRRHQKIIEETPCNFVDQKILDAMYQAAILVAKTVNYKNIGTVEFLVTPDNNFYFLEMNTRLQVEHSVTEFTTGLDLVALQIEIAQTGKLPHKQKDISRKNHAIECRIYAEDPEQNFLPSTGKIHDFSLPRGYFLRIDHNLEKDQDITSFFDPMICKLTTWAKDRSGSIGNMLIALDQLNIYGVKTNKNFLKNILKSKEFLTGNIHTQLLDNKNYFNNMNQDLKDKDPYQYKIAKIALNLFKQINKKEPKPDTYNNWKDQKWK